MNPFFNFCRYIFFSLGILCIATPLQAQIIRGKGLVFNASDYKKEVKRGRMDEPRGRPTPNRFSLRNFCPTPQNQGSEPSCAAWAIAYGALTIQQAIHRKVVGQKEVDKIAHSKSFIFNQLVEKEKAPIPTVESIFKFLESDGTCLAATFRNDEPLTKLPDELATLEAKDYTLDTFRALFYPDSSMKKHILLFKRLLFQNHPIVVGLRVPYSFSDLTTKKFSYDPTKDIIDSAAHAMCLVGYDDIDSTFELMNSWGTNWGDNGFVRIRYNDMLQLMCCAYRLIPKFWAVKQEPIPMGEIILRRGLKYHEDVPQYEEIRVQYDSVNQYYQTIQPNWAVGSRLQLALRQAPQDWWVNVFNIDIQGNITIFYNLKIDNKLIEEGIPKDSLIAFDEKGTEWLCILYTKDSISPFQEPLEKIVKSNLNAIGAALPLFFKDRLDETAIITPKRMGFHIPEKSESKGALMILKLEIRE